jgi:hypothetical protein
MNAALRALMTADLKRVCGSILSQIGVYPHRAAAAQISG